MTQRTLLVLGGYGQTGRRVVQRLASRTDHRIIIAGRDGAAAERLAAGLDGTNQRIVGRSLDAASITPADLNGVDLLVNVSSASAHAARIIDACIEARVDWCDSQLDRRQAAVLQGRVHDIASAGLSVVTQAGFHPGVPAALVRWAASRVDVLTDAWTAGCMHEEGGLVASSASGELFDEFRDYRAHVFERGSWRRASMWSMADMPMVDFAFGLGRMRTYPFDLAELRMLPGQLPGLERLGFSVAGFDPVTDYLLTPLLMVGARVGSWTYPWLARAMAFTTRTFGRAPFGNAVQCDAAGVRNGERVTLHAAIGHADAYELTAAPVVSMVEQMLDGTARPIGLHHMGNVVDPDRLLADCAAMCLSVATRA